MRLFAGIDGGQSSTTCFIGDEMGRVLGVGRAGPCNHAGASEGRARFLNAIEGSLREAARTAGVAAPSFQAACLGLSGGPADKEELARQAIRSEQYFITHDAMTALAGATAGAPGIVAIAGTGSIAFGRNASGATARAGGWGYLFGDEGGAFDIVRQALRAVLRNEERWGPSSILRELLLDETGTPDANTLMHLFYTDAYPRDKIAAFAPLVDHAAHQGDAIAQEILRRAAQSLATFTAAVRGQLFDRGGDVDVRFVGGVFRSEFVRERFRALVELEDGCRVSAPAHGPAAGALLEAYRLAGVVCTLEAVPEET